MKQLSIGFDSTTNQLRFLVRGNRRQQRELEAALREIGFVLKKAQQVKKAIVEKSPLAEPVLA